MIRYVVEVHNGSQVHVCPVVNLYDIFGNAVTDPALASSGVLQLPDGFISVDATDIGNGFHPVQ